MRNQSSLRAAIQFSTLAVLVLCGAKAFAARADPRPNVLFIVVDDLSSEPGLLRPPAGQVAEHRPARGEGDAVRPAPIASTRSATRAGPRS